MYVFPVEMYDKTTQTIKIPMKYVRTGIIASLVRQVEYQSNIANDEISKSPKPPSLIYLWLGEKEAKHARHHNKNKNNVEPVTAFFSEEGFKTNTGLWYLGRYLVAIWCTRLHEKQSR